MTLNKHIWERKYKNEMDSCPEDTFRRVAGAVAGNDPGLKDKFFAEMNSLRFIPGGRILAAAGTNKPKATLSNCFVMSPPDDSMSGILNALNDGALTMQAGGGIGVNFSKLRPFGDPVEGTGSIASGPVSFMHMWNAMSMTISGVGDRKGAMIAVLNCDHPDIMRFITAKANNSKEHKVLEKFNLSVGITDDFLHAVKSDGTWDLKFNGKVYKTVRAREIWDTIMENAHRKAEPGILFLSRINELSNLKYCEHIDATNPCGEQPLAPFGSCNLGAVNLSRFVTHPFTDKADFAFPDFHDCVRTSVRFLDNVLDINYYPLNEQREDARRKRKIGLGIMGLGTALAMLRVRYGSDESIEWVDKIMSFMRDTACSYSVELGEEKGTFPLFDPEKYLDGAFIKGLPENIRESIRTKGIRNANLLTIAPTGSISQLAGNVSSGVEPIFCIEYERTNYGEVTPVKDPAFQLYCDLFGQVRAKDAPGYFVGAHDLTPEEHLKVMAACQKYIDASISKTINLPASITVKEMEDVYLHAYELGCKGCTVYREGSLDEEILRKKEARKQSFNPEGYYDLDGKRYQVKIPESKHAYYLNFSHVRNGEGSVKPFELFINTKDPMVDEWTRALGRLVSAVFRNLDDPTFLADEFKEVYAQSGFFSSRRRKFVPSLVAEFGHVLADYFSHIGLTEQEVPIEAYAEANGDDTKATPHLGYCKKCGQQSLIYQEGCMKCINPACLYNRCG